MALQTHDNPPHILLIEDEDAHAELICRGFEHSKEPYIINAVQCLTAARNYMEKSTPDLIISDLLLPDGKGTDLLADKQIPLIVMTSKGNEEAAVQALKGGALDYIVKSDTVFRDMPQIAERALREWGHIRERRKAEAALLESEQRFRAVFNSEHIMMLIIDPDTGDIVDASPAACAFYGYNQDDFRKKNVFDISTLPHEIASEYLQKVKMDLHGHFESKDRLASGQIRDVESFVSVIVTGGRGLLFAVLQDATERKLAEAALRESEERFRAVFESAEEGIIIKDLSLRYTQVNPAICNLLGLSALEIVGKRAEDLYGPVIGAQRTALETRVLQGESIDCEQTTPVGGLFLTFHDTMVPLTNMQGEIIGICCISRNITERKKLAEAREIRRHMHYPSPAMRSVMAEGIIGARKDCIILLLGESGTGKDHLARWLHEHSRQAAGPFLAINCAALPKELAESELFGHERGAFTGANNPKKGLLELAESGTILLNEIGELDLGLQAKLLTFLDTRTFMRVGGQKPLHVNARLIAATHRNLDVEVREGRFIGPLFYRLSVFPLHVPPLRERIEDIPMLAEELLSMLALEMQLPSAPRLQPHHIRTLSQYQWPGNVRELRNVLERSLILYEHGEFNLAFPAAGRRDDVPDKQEIAEKPHEQTDGEWSYLVRYMPGATLREVINGVASSLCAEILRQCNDNKKETARLLDISRDTLYRYLKKIDLESNK